MEIQVIEKTNGRINFAGIYANEAITGTLVSKLEKEKCAHEARI